MCNFLNYFSMLAVSAKPVGNTRRSPTECPPAPTCSKQRACGSAGASYALTVQWRSDDMKNPDSTGQQRPTILAGLNHNHCGVWRFWGWLDLAGPAVQHGPPCWKCHCPIVHSHISHRGPRNLSSTASLQKILPFPRP